MMPYNKRVPLCPFCNEPVELETSKTNENGKAVHEDCYVATLRRQPSPDPPKKIAAA